jgi:hypothetical protein
MLAFSQKYMPNLSNNFSIQPAFFPNRAISLIGSNPKHLVGFVYVERQKFSIPRLPSDPEA